MCAEQFLIMSACELGALNSFCLFQHVNYVMLNCS
jgi:hypothetical protein